nr:uncharacterized protein LOC109622037 [Aedes albopictus]
MQKSYSRKTASRFRTEEELHPLPEDTVEFRYKGQLFSIPRSEYNRPLTQQEVEQPDCAGSGELFRLVSDGRTHPSSSVQSKKEMSAESSKARFNQGDAGHQSLKMKNALDESLQFFKNLEDSFRQTANLPEENSSKKTEEEDPIATDNIFTLEDLVESKETIIEQPITKNLSQQTVSRSDSCKIPKPSTESLKLRKPEEVTVKLFQLKSKVVNLIDQTISQIESNEGGTAGVGDHPSSSIPLHPSGDGSTLDYRQRNLEVLKTDSFVRSRKDIRSKLYREIRTVLKRLEDLDMLE